MENALRGNVFGKEHVDQVGRFEYKISQDESIIILYFHNTFKEALPITPIV